MPPQGESKNSTLPDVTGISPNEGPVGGGQRVILRGSNLGTSKEDVVRLVMADVDCTDTLEYYSTCEWRGGERYQLLCSLNVLNCLAYIWVVCIDRDSSIQV